MVECICIDDKNKPKEIPDAKWIKEGNKYNIIYTVIVLPQKELAVMLSEIELTDNELPYEYFLAKRFAISPENVNALFELIKNCSETDFSMEELLEQTNIQELDKIET
jgi:hypothetical protein